MKEGSHVNKVVGIPGEQESLYKEYLQRESDVLGTEKIDGEIEKTERDIEIIDFAQNAADEYVRKYGGSAKPPVPLEKIHLISEGATTPAYGGLVREGGSHSSYEGSIILEKFSSEVNFALEAFHECMHAKSFIAFQMSTSLGSDGKPYLVPYRSGFSVVSRDGKNIYFESIEEAIISTLERKFYEEVLKTSDRFQEKDAVPQFSRPEEYEKLSQLIDDLLKKNETEYTDRNQIVDIFIRAGITGKLLDVARLIEKTYGVGHFRKLANEDLREVELT